MKAITTKHKALRTADSSFCERPMQVSLNDSTMFQTKPPVFEISFPNRAHIGKHDGHQSRHTKSRIFDHERSVESFSSSEDSDSRRGDFNH